MISTGVKDLASGGIVRARHYVGDISRRKRAELALAQERDIAQNYLDIAGAILCVIVETSWSAAQKEAAPRWSFGFHWRSTGEHRPRRGIRGEGRRRERVIRRDGAQDAQGFSQTVRVKLPCSGSPFGA